MNEITSILSRIEHGDPRDGEQLFLLIYEDLRRLAAQALAQEKPGQTFEATGLVHEAYLRLVGTATAQHWNSRGHFYAAAAEAMQRILVENARRKNAEKRGGQYKRAEIELGTIASQEPDEKLLLLDEALTKLAAQDSRKAKLVKLRYFAGLTIGEAAEVLEISTATADRDWAYARAWLQREMAGNTGL